MRGQKTGTWLVPILIQSKWKLSIMRGYNIKGSMGEKCLLLGYSVKNCYTNAKKSPAEKDQSLDFSCSTSLLYIGTFHNRHWS